MSNIILFPYIIIFVSIIQCIVLFFNLSKKNVQLFFSNKILLILLFYTLLATRISDFSIEYSYYLIGIYLLIFLIYIIMSFKKNIQINNIEKTILELFLIGDIVLVTVVYFVWVTII